MECIECKATNPELNRYCGQCGASLGRSLEGTIQQENIRDRNATEYAITESVMERLFKWTKWLGIVTAIPLFLFAILLGWSYRDIRSALEKGKDQIGIEVQNSKTEIEAVRQASGALKGQVVQPESDVDGYKRTNAKIEELQKKLLHVEGQVIDLGKHDLKVNTLSTTGPGPFYLQVGEIGCPTEVPKGYTVLYCVQGSPPSLSQVTATGGYKPVASVSSVGFQDSSTSSKPACVTSTRGTFFVEKGKTGAVDNPFLCVKK